MDFGLTELSIERTYNIELINEILSSDGIYEFISEDGAELSKQRFDVYGECWLKILSDGVCIGLYNIHQINGITFEGHVHMLTKYRKEYSDLGLKAVYSWLVSDGPECVKKIIVNIPEIYKNVIDFCERNGFKREGVNRLSHLKNGELYDLVMLGITLDEIKEVLNG